MNPERWKQIDQIFHAVLESEPSVRAEFLAEAYEGDAQLQKELERLIACHEKKPNLLDRPPTDLVLTRDGESAKSRKFKVILYK
jgi:hypothetical protein